MTDHVLFICRSCAVSKHQREHLKHRCGFHLLEQLKQQVEVWDAPFSVREVECWTVRSSLLDRMVADKKGHSSPKTGGMSETG